MYLTLFIQQQAANLSHLDMTAAQQQQMQSCQLQQGGTSSVPPAATASASGITASVSANCLNDESCHSNKERSVVHLLPVCVVVCVLLIIRGSSIIRNQIV